MTVAELIEELRKFPEHHAVVARHPEGFNYASGAVEFGLGSIEEVRSDAAFSDRAPVVVIDIAEWCR
jgi:hypothetical protein